jgi:hypothetical protein
MRHVLEDAISWKTLSKFQEGGIPESRLEALSGRIVCIKKHLHVLKRYSAKPFSPIMLVVLHCTSATRAQENLTDDEVAYEMKQCVLRATEGGTVSAGCYVEYWQLFNPFVS